MNVYSAVDCQGFAGGFTLGVAQAGFQLVGKREMKGGFGVANCEVNRHLLPGPWESEAVDPATWSVPQHGADLVFGNPPCSGFSVMSAKAFRGAESKINHCMWAFAEYAARVRPEIAIFESVPQAFNQGRSLMTALRAKLEELTGQSWNLHHVLHNALSVGGPSMRRRYFWVAARVPFGVECPKIEMPLPTLRATIGDLIGQPFAWEALPYANPQVSEYATQFIRRDGLVDGHIGIDNTTTRRTRDILDGVDWNPGEHLQVVTRRYHEKYGGLPKSWAHSESKLISRDFFQGFTTPTMWQPDEPCRVITGAGLLNGVHWEERRTFTHREVARIMGFPDDWLIEPLKGKSGLFMTWGKGITVHCGRWIAKWARRALDGEPGEMHGDPIGDREYLINITNAWRGGCGTVKIESSVKRRETTVTEAAAPTEAAETAARGRPRPTETVERDEHVFGVLSTTEGLNREQIAEKVAHVVPSDKVYLSLWRLRRDGRVRRDRQGGAHLWFRAE